MKIGPKYKIARRLGAPIFEKTQTQKFALSEAKKTRTKGRGRGGRRNPSVYGTQLLEKQKARLTYGVSEKQFSNYVTKALSIRGVKPAESLFSLLEKRLDNVTYKLGLATTRRFARQVVSHGHITINGRKMTIPSYQVRKGDVVAIREGSKNNSLFTLAKERIAENSAPVWIKTNKQDTTAEIIDEPNMSEVKDMLFDLSEIIEFYSR